MSLRDAISDIIRQRKAKADSFAKRKDAYTAINNKVDGIMQAIRSIDSNNAEVVELLGKDFLDAINKINPTGFTKKYKELVKLLDKVRARYSQAEINISVIGFARQGKSTLLQSISGLDNTVIPAFDNADCTGAISTIRNVENAPTTAKVYFKSKEEMLATVNRYIDEIGSDVISKASSFDDIENVNVYRLRDSLLSAQDADIVKCDQLAKYVDHFDEWSQAVEEFDGTGSYLELRDPKQIMKYVAQHNGKAESDPLRENYYNYLAVSKVEISCEFNYADAGKIVLRDTIGLGDARMLGLQDSMMSSIASDCDAAVVIMRPKDNTDNMRQQDFNFYKDLQASCREMGLDMNQWFFFVVNQMKGKKDNTEGCRRIIDQLAPLAKADVYMADATNSSEVTDKILIPMLTKLRTNLPLLDRALENQVDELAAQVYDEYSKIFDDCERANRLCHVNQNWRDRLNREFISNFQRANAEFAKLTDSYQKQSREQSRELSDAIMKLAPNIGGEDCIIPQYDEIYASLIAGGIDSNPVIRMIHYLHRLRNDFTKEFVKMDEVLNKLVYKMQKEIVELLSDTLLFGKLVGKTPDDMLVEMKEEFLAEKRAKKVEFVPEDANVLDGKQYSRWLMTAHDILAEKFGGGEYEDILLAISFIARFNISVRSFLLHRVRSCIDILDPTRNSAPQLMMTQMQVETREQQAETIHAILEDVYVQAYDNVINLVQKMYAEPNQLLYSAVAEFNDRMFYSLSSKSGYMIDVKDTWSNIYNDGVEIFHRDLYNASEKAAQLNVEFTNMARMRMTKSEFLNLT